ncbi:MAG: carboxypeptidase regulatory-like domain-containing protein, partial [Candidatus Cloacimonetes bacterium]|nr:carboxypeptidase regulatory-like domain-containing protein [Candidatus Cloacimonadota bacterium]
IYAKVILPGDQNTTNDQSPSLNVLVMGAGALVVSIGDGTSVNTITGYPTPYGTYYKNFHQQYLYTAAELTTAGASAGLITALAFNVQNVNNCSPMPNYTMKIKHTTQTTLTTTFEVGDYQQVWFQNDFVPVGGWNTHPFTTPFVWDGVSNILVDIITTLIPGAYTQNAQVYYTATTGTNTSLRYQSDSADAAGSLTGTTSVNRANIRFTLNMDGTGSLEGIVTSGGNPVDGVLININDTVFQQTTDATGHYQFPFLQPGNYTITASKLGYETQTLPAVIVADQATTLNINLIASSVVNVTGTVVGSDSPTVGLPDATILLEGVLEYSATTNAHGQFTVTGVLSGNAYNYTITRAGYQPGVGTITVGAGNYNMGTVILNELTLPPVQVLAELNPPETAITLTWRPPGSTGGAEDEDFELSNGEWVPSSNWTNPLGDWEWTDEYDIADWSPVYTGTSVIPPPTAHSGTGMWGTKINTNYTNSGGFSYLTKTIDFTGFTNTTMRFWSWENLFGDWDYAQVRVNGTLVWGPSWDYTGTQWRERIINLSAFDGMADVTVVFEMFATTTVNYAGWYIDDLFIGSGDAIAQTSPASIMPAHLRTLNESEAAVIAENLAQKAPQPTLRSAAQAYSNSSRLPVGYKVWRLLQGNEQNEATWTLLTPTVIIDTFFVMQGWQGIPDGHYRWAVKTVYTNDVLSNPAFSNMIRKRPNDLSALSINGSTTPSVGILNTYNITIKNTGTAAQTAGAYSVKLMSGTTELGTTTGPALAVDEEAIVAVTWTPATPGPMALFGKTVHAGDTDPTNDSSPELNISVLPAGVIAGTVGGGNPTDGKPFEFLNNNSLYQCLYYPSELGRFGNITALSFYNNFTTNFVNKPIKIWLGTTQLNDLSGGWILPATNLTLVYDGTANFPSGANTITIPLQTQFQYTSGNLVLYANRPMDTTIGVAADDFLVQTVGSNRARKLSSNTVTYDPESPSATGTLSGQFPKATFHMTSIGTTPLYAVTPSGRNFGTVLIESVNNQTFTVTNAGGAPLTVSTISISGSPHFTLQDMPTLPASLEFGEAITFLGRYNPTAEGTHAATITINDNMTRLPHNIELNGTCIDTQINTLPYVQNFDTVTTPNLPPDWNSYVQATVTTAYVQTYTTTPHSTPNTAGLANSSDANATLLLIAPPYANTIPTNTTRVKFWGRSSSANYTVMVGVMTDYQDPATFTSVQTIALTTTWTEYVVTFAGYTGTGRTVAFKHGLGGTTRTIYIDDVMLEVIPQNDLAALSILGNSTPTVGIPSNYTVNVFNWGSNPQTTYQVKLFKEGDVEVGSVDGPTINPGITQGVVVPWTPDTQGATSIYGKVVLTGDQNNLNDQTSNMGVFVQPPGTLAFTVGVGDQTARIPLDMFYKNSMHQYIIYPAEIGNTIGQIFGISLYNQFTQDLNLPIKVWIGTTTQTDLSAGWIPVTNHSLVYDANLQFPTGENTLTITFNAPYLYLTGENLVITFNRPMDTQYYSSTNYFKAQTGTELRARNIYSDSTTYDPANPPTTGGTNSAQFPKTTLLIIPGGVGHLNGTVLGVGNQPLEGVHVQLAPGGYQTTTNAQGQYQIMNILPNDYAVTFSRWGYLDSVQNVTIEEDETETLNVTMTQMPTVSVTGTINASDTGAGINGAGIHLVG